MRGRIFFYADVEFKLQRLCDEHLAGKNINEPDGAVTRPMSGLKGRVLWLQWLRLLPLSLYFSFMGKDFG